MWTPIGCGKEDVLGEYEDARLHRSREVEVSGTRSWYTIMARWGGMVGAQTVFAMHQIELRNGPGITDEPICLTS